MADTYKAGDKFTWNCSVTIEVTRVARDGTWADLKATGPGGNSWSKRQKLPLDESYTRTTSSAS